MADDIMKKNDVKKKTRAVINLNDVDETHDECVPNASRFSAKS